MDQNIEFFSSSINFLKKPGTNWNLPVTGISVSSSGFPKTKNWGIPVPVSVLAKNREIRPD
jgi:hypothetical protein